MKTLISSNTKSCGCLVFSHPVPDTELSENLPGQMRQRDVTPIDGVHVQLTG